MNIKPISENQRVVVQLAGWLFACMISAIAPPLPAQQLQSLEHDPVFGTNNSLIQVDADTYALAYTGLNASSIKTFNIPPDGSAITEVQSLVYEVHDGFSAEYNSFVRVDTDTFALAYGKNELGIVTAFNISADGSTIQQVQLTVHEFEEGAVSNALIPVDVDTFALAYQERWTGWNRLKTFAISPDQSSLITEIQQQVVNRVPTDDPSYLNQVIQSNSMVKVDSDTFALAFTDGFQHPITMQFHYQGVLKTFNISADGLSIVEIEETIHESVLPRNNSLVHVDQDTFALAYGRQTGIGVLKSFTVSADGSTITEIHALEHDSAKATENSLVRVESDTYSLAYQGQGDGGFLKTFGISADGLMIAEIDVLRHEGVFASSNSLLKIDDDTYILAYQGDGDDGFLKTFGIASDGTFPLTFEEGFEDE